MYSMNQYETHLDLGTIDRRGAWSLTKSYRRVTRLVALAALFLTAGCAQQPAQNNVPETLAVLMRPDQAIAPFSANPTGGLPLQWDPMVIFRTKKQTRYQLVTDQGKTVLHAFAADATSGLMQHVDVEPSAQPWLSWDWKIGN